MTLFQINANLGNDLPSDSACFERTALCAEPGFALRRFLNLDTNAELDFLCSGCLHLCMNAKNKSTTKLKNWEEWADHCDDNNNNNNDGGNYRIVYKQNHTNMVSDMASFLCSAYKACMTGEGAPPLISAEASKAVWHSKSRFKSRVHEMSPIWVRDW